MTDSPDSNASLLQNLTIPISCTESWEAMQGNEQIRHCGLCKKNVYNLSAMPQAEAAALLAGNVDGKLCVRFYRRSDGTVMTSDCGASPRAKVRRMLGKLPRAATRAAGVAGAAAVALSVAHAQQEPHPPVLMGAPPPIAVPVETTPAPDHDRQDKQKKQEAPKKAKRTDATGA